MKIKILMSICLVAVGGCASRYTVLSTPMVSMTKYSYTDGKLNEVGPVSERFCRGEQPLSSRTHDVGLIDEVTLKAQNAQGADYIGNAVYSIEGSCMVLEGTAYKKVEQVRRAQSSNTDRKRRRPSSDVMAVEETLLSVDDSQGPEGSE